MTLQPESPNVSSPQVRTVAIAPWLALKVEVTVNGVTFTSFRDGGGRVNPTLAGATAALSNILSSYREIDGTPISDCTVAMIDGSCFLSEDRDYSRVNRAIAMLFLASFAKNSYFTQFRSYVNSSHFRMVWQSFLGDAGSGVAIISRRRDGRTKDGGYDHGEVHFIRPEQCQRYGDASPDEAFVTALDRMTSLESPTHSILETALDYAQLANTDDSIIDYRAEAILMASVFEQLLDADDKYALVTKFGTLWAGHETMSVANALPLRPGIKLDQKPDRKAAQLLWPLHKKWIEELYSLRNSAAHEGKAISGAWTPTEHLVMAAFVFPLLVKLKLATEGLYSLSDSDRASCRSVDRLLALPRLTWNHKSTRESEPYRESRRAN